MASTGARGPLTKQGIIVLGAGLLAGALGILPRPTLDVRWEGPAIGRDSYVPNARRGPGEELVFVVIGSSGCLWSNLPETISLVREARDSVIVRAEARQMTVATVGVAKDIVADHGIRHLRRFGTFDELTTGRGWWNAGVFRYIYDEFPGPAVTPQVLVMSRTLARIGGQSEIADERVLVRRAGLAEISSWVGSGVKIPARSTLNGN